MMPVGPQIQSQYQSCKSMWNMGHRCQAMDPLLVRLCAGGSIYTYDDMYCSFILLNAALCGDLTANDTVLMLSIDGTLLHPSKDAN